MSVKILKLPEDSDWLLARQSGLNTKDKVTNEVPSSSLKLKMIASEHSMIRELYVSWKWENLPYWVSVHFVRHKIGIEHFVESQRNDRQHNYDRTKAPQDAPVNHICFANFQEILNISRVRVCYMASKETREAWQEFLDTLAPYEPELVSLCVPNCVYRNGICPEVFSKCKYNTTEKFMAELEEYRKIFQKE